jgi:DNA-binding SARP family transcriptional activator
LTTFKSNKVRALLAYLDVEQGGAHHRDVLAGMLWPESTNRQALAMLRDNLSNLRRVLGDRDVATPLIQVVGDTLQVDPDVLWLDVAAFTALVEDGAAERETLGRAVALYRGDFLDGFSLGGSPEFEAWVLRRRGAYQSMMLDALYRLTTLDLQCGDYAAAQANARRQLALDNYCEDAHRQLLRALALDGQRNQALSHYAAYRALLDEELGVAPDIRTEALYQRIRDHQLAPTSKVIEIPLRTGEISVESDTSSFVARDAELARLKTGLYRAQQGAGQVLLVAGEAGSGKTLLLETFIRRHVSGAADTLAAWGACNAQVGSGDPYLPFRAMLRLLTGDFETATLSESLTPALAQRLEASVPNVVAALQELGPDLIGTLLPASTRLASSDSQRTSTPPRPAALCDQVARVLRAIARHHTLILVLDDVHWADTSTLNLLGYLSRQLHDSRILLIVSYRPAEAPPALTDTLCELKRRWGDLTLDLERAAGQTFVDAFLDSMPNVLGPPFRERLYQQTGGQALFTVALVKHLQTEGELRRNAAGEWEAQDDLAWHHLPPRVEAVIEKRILRLPDTLRSLLHVASVEGETFTAEVVARALKRPTDMVQQALSGALRQTHQLVVAQGMEHVGARRVARYRFRHILFQQYLYTQLDPVQRAYYHEAVGTALEALGAGLPDRAVRLAYHFEAAGILEKAVIYLTQAGAYAYRLSAPDEAVTFYRRALGLLERLPDSESRERLELTVQMQLEGPLLVTQGWGAPERVVALERAYGLAQRVDDIPNLLTVLYALSDLRTAQSKNRQALASAEQLLSIAQQVGDRGYELLGYRMTGVSHFLLGQYQAARTHLEHGLASYALLHQEPAPSTKADIERAIFLWAWLPHVLLGLGYPEQAEVHVREALKRVQPDGPAHAQAIMLTIAATSFYAIAHCPRSAFRYAEELRTLVTEHKMVGFMGWATFFRGWARVAQGECQAGLLEMTSGLDEFHATNTQGSLSLLNLLLADAYARNGETERGAAILGQTHDLAIQTEAASHLAEIYRLQGELCPETDPAQAEAYFMCAIDVAQRQEARFWELRATVSLARLWQAQGHISKAHARLAAIYGWFTEGFDTPDLVEAASLLQTLAGSDPS